MNAIWLLLTAWSLLVPAVVREEPADGGASSDQEVLNALMDGALVRADEPAQAIEADVADEPDDQENAAPTEHADDSEDADSDAAAKRPDRAPKSISGVNLSGADVDVQTVGSDTIIITGNEHDVAMLEAIIQLLDEEGPQKKLQVVTLEKAGAKRVAEKIEAIYSKFKEREEDRVSAVAVAPTVVILAAPVHLMDEAVNIVHTIDIHSALPDTAAITFQIKHRRASEAAEQLKNVLDTLRKNQGEDAGPELEIIPIDANNTILIAAPESERAKIQRLLDSIDVEPAEGWGDILLAVFPLYNTKPDELADTINELIEVQAQAGQAKPGEEPIRRLRMVVRTPDGEPYEVAPLDLEKPLRILPDEGTGSLIVATVESNIEPMDEIINILDGVPGSEEVGIKVFHLRYADAETLSEMLDDMFQGGKDLPKPAPGSESSHAVPEGAVGEALVYNIAVTTDLRTNTLMIAGKAAQIALVTTLVGQLDVPSAATRFPLRLITLENTDATHMGTIIEQLFEKRLESLEQSDAGKTVVERERVFLSVDIRSNSLIVAASEENYAEIIEITEKLDSTGDRLVDNIRIINCENTSAADMAGKIGELWQRKADLRSEGELPTDQPVIVADTRSNAMVVASSPEDYTEIKRLVDRLESQPLAPIAQIRLIKLENNDASQIGDMLKGLFEERMQQRLASGQEENPADRVAFANDPATNMILVASSKENYDEMMRIIEVIDSEPDVEGVVKFYVCHNAEATNVAEKIDELFQAGIYNPTVGLDSSLIEERQKVTVIADPRSNAVIASAGKPNLAIVERLIELMDTEDAPLLKDDTRVFALGTADALQLAQMLEDLFDGIKSDHPEPDLVRKPTIIAHERSNSLFVTGSRDSLKRCEDVITRIEEQGVQRTAVFQIYRLEHAAAAPLAEKMQETFDQREQGGSDGDRTPIYILPDEGTNSLICSASRDDQEVIQNLLELLDIPSDIARQFEIFPLKVAKAEPVAERLDTLFQSQAAGAGGSTRADAIAVEPDPRTNSLIVWAAPSQMENVGVIINKMDTQEPLKEMQMRVIRLKHAIAEDFSEKFTETLFGGESQSAGSDDQESVILSFIEKQDDGTEVTRKLLRQDITITGDPRTNALMVLAPAESIEMLEQLICEIDKMPPQLAEIRLFPLVNADAEEMVERLEALFEPDQGSAGEMEQQLIFGDGGVASVTASADGSSVQAIRFTADRRTNTVIAAGGEADLNMAEKLIRLIDAQTADDRITEVYQVRYSTSEDLTAAMKEFVEEENDRLSELDDESAILRQAEKHVTLIGDEATNSVLVGASPRYYSGVMEMIRQIDRPPPQVMIQVLIAEVSLDDNVEFGMEFAMQDLAFTESAHIGPNGVVKGNDFDFVGGVDVGAGGAAGSFGGFSFSITGEDFNFLLRALQSDGVLQILQRPTILVENNEEANITIGDRVPFVRSSSVSDSGQTTSSVEYEDVGIILDVIPHINPDGYVNLEVKPEISSLNPAGSGVQISEGLTAPTFSERSAETVVTVKDGETVVIGGLITTREDEREVKVPILGDIPGLGLLFRSTTSQRKRNELLIVLTVDVIRDEYDAYQMSVEQRDKSGLMTPKILHSPLMEGLRILPEDQAFGSPDEEGVQPGPRRRHEVPEDRELYGPTPDVYGPERPQRIKVQESKTTQGEIARVYGPTPPARLVAATP